MPELSTQPEKDAVKGTCTGDYQAVVPKKRINIDVVRKYAYLFSGKYIL